MMKTHRILKPGRNCWRIENADRVAFLIDGRDYFLSLYHSIIRAQRIIQILAWDIDSRFELVRDTRQTAEWPVRLCDLLNEVIRKRSDLHAYVLDWDFAMIYATDREFMPIYKFDWTTDRRLHFCLDDRHPVGASQHQKVVVIDDIVAYAGGLDITRGRWDTPEHLPRDRRRCDGNTEPYRPYHDTQMAVSGNVATALGELARQRWARVDRHGPPPPDPAGDPWPPDLVADLTNVDVAIARTQPQYLDAAEIQEIELLYLDAIAAARRFIYIENQYLTAGRIAEALLHRLDEADGPEIVILLPLKTDGWLAQSTMDVMREELIRRMRQADRHRHLGTYYPYMPDQGDQPINLHAKVLIIDDELVRIGSSNLNNRSMGLDSECDLAIEAGGETRIQHAIAALRNRLLAEHLGTETDVIARTMASTSSLLATIAQLRSNQRSLRPLPSRDHVNTGIDTPMAQMVDPERPVNMDELVGLFIDDTERPSARRRISWWITLLLIVLVLTVSWRWTPLAHWLSIDRLLASAQWLRQLPLAPLPMLGVFVIACQIAMPVTLLIIVTILVFGTWPGIGYALAGSTLGALGNFLLGRLFGRDIVRRFVGKRINALSRHLARRGLLTVIMLRIFPVAPFTVINLVAGASHLRLRDFTVGTIVGIMPAIVAISIFTDSILASVEAPGMTSYATLAVAVVVIGIAAFLLRHWLKGDELEKTNITPSPGQRSDFVTPPAHLQDPGTTKTRNS